MRKILHVDMDAFYASIEQRDRPELRGRPVVVGGAPRSRGVVCTASYEARVFGVRSAMPAAEAYRRCPDAVFLKPDMARYRAVGEQVREVFRRYTDLVEPLSIDEAFLDVTADRFDLGSATAIAEAIRREIRAETQLTASAGVAPNKFLAKVASDMQKPDGLVVIPPARVAEVLADLPVRRIPGVGPKTAEVCKRFGIEVAGDFLRYSEDRLRAWFGDSATRYQALAQGIDDRPVNPDRIRKSASVEDTFARDLVGTEACAAELRRLAEALAKRLASNDVSGSTVVLKVKYADSQQVTRSRTLPWPVHRADDLFATARTLLDETEAARRSVRLLGIGVSKLSGEDRQLLLRFLERPSAQEAHPGSD